MKITQNFVLSQRDPNQKQEGQNGMDREKASNVWALGFGGELQKKMSVGTLLVVVLATLMCMASHLCYCIAYVAYQVFRQLS